MNKLQTPQWPGHVPGRFYFGMDNDVPQRGPAQHPGGPLLTQANGVERASAVESVSYGVRRISVPWGQWNRALSAIVSAHRRLQLPWVSIRSPHKSDRAWHNLTSGAADSAVEEFGRSLAVHLELPALVTFHDEPEAPLSSNGAATWAEAYCRFHDILEATTGMRLITPAPIVSDWLFNPANPRRNPDEWLTPGVLARAPLLGVTVYENASGETFERRVPRILTWLQERGFGDTMIGIAGSGRTAYAPPYVAPERWLNESLAWTAKHTDKVAVVHYSSCAPERGVYWPLSRLQHPNKAITAWIGHAITHL